MSESPLGPVLRDLEPADESAVLRLFGAAADWFQAATGNPSGPADVQSLYYALPEGADPAAKKLLVMEFDGEVVGIVDVVVGYPTATSAACGLFLVDPAVRGRGIGVAVAGQLIETARSRGLQRVTVTVPASQDAGCRLLDRVGFDVQPLDPRTVSGNRRAWPGERDLLGAQLRL